MNTHTIIPFRAKRCDTLALQLVRESVKASLVASKAEKKFGSRALRALEVAVRTYVACAWCFAILATATIVLAVPAFLIGYVVGHFTR